MIGFQICTTMRLANVVILKFILIFINFKISPFILRTAILRSIIVAVCKKVLYAFELNPVFMKKLVFVIVICKMYMCRWII